MNNEMILASAGSGKTWQLTNRYIAIMGRDLLAGNEPRPEAILAVTFTRKAAGEFFDEILKKLATGASSEEAARELAGKPEPTQNPLYSTLKNLQQKHYQELLELFIERMPRLFLGTLDSLFANIVRSFPAEFGLAGGFDVLNEHSAQLARNDVFRSVFNSSANKQDPGDFLEAFHLATVGSTEASVQRLLDKFIADHHPLLLSAASLDYWGNPHRIWPGGSEWLQGIEADYAELLPKLYSFFEEEKFSERQSLYWEEFRAQLPLTTPGNLPKRVAFFLTKFLENWEALKDGEAILSVSKKQKFGAAECEILRKITIRLVGDELRHYLIRTQGIWAILAQYESTYAAKVRRKGKLTFHDIAVLLAGTPSSPGPLLAQGPGEDERLRIDYRLDARFDHWLLDEFQDTSHLQWSVIENLVDEAIQDPSGERSLFQVGDTKQAIYAWRGGDAQLFNDIAERYQGTDERSLKLRDLSLSWRSGEDVISPLNQIFGDKGALADLGFPPAALDQWHWTTHEVAAPNRKHPGLTAYYRPEPAEGEKACSEDCFALTLALLEEIQPIKNGLSCVILVQGNKEGRAIVDYLRAHTTSGIPVVSESDVAVATDNPVTLAFLNLFHLAAHPNDPYAQGHLKLSPLYEIVTQNNLTIATVANKVRKQIYQIGFEATLRCWMRLTEAESLLDDPFSRQRLEELALAARLFDQEGDLSLDRFLSYTKSYTLREPNTKSAVQVMTIHMSKGLTFDMAILPQLGGNSLTTARSGMGVQRNRETREVEWIYNLPRKAIAECDQQLLEHRTQLEAEASYEQLCKFYVALTRARYANYLIASPRSPKSRTNNFVKLLDDTIAYEDPESATLHDVTYQVAFESDLPTSRERWWEEIKTNKEQPAPEPNKFSPKEMTPKLRPTRSTPSRAVEQTTLFTSSSQQSTDALELGSAVHELLEQIEWWQSDLPEFDLSNYPAEAVAHLERLLSSSLGQQLLAKPQHAPNEAVELWREQNFEIIVDDKWTSGTIDRVHIVRNEQGQALSASIIDFKTDQVGNESEAEKKATRYDSQMTSYRKAVATLLNLEPEKVHSFLLFTALPYAVDICQ